jgi:ribonuclease P protein subunit RPR2
MDMVSKNYRKEIALERIYRLFELAEKEFGEGAGRTKRYVELARKMSTRNKAPIPAELKKSFCRKCGCFLKKGKNAEWKDLGELVEITCGECGFSFKKGKQPE